MISQTMNIETLTDTFVSLSRVTTRTVADVARYSVVAFRMIWAIVPVLSTLVNVWKSETFICHSRQSSAYITRIPSHSRPFLRNPLLHMHSNDPMVFMQVEWDGQLCPPSWWPSLHSSRSVGWKHSRKKNTCDSERWCAQQASYRVSI